MKNRILTKLRSRTGASITFALLLFLVCAVLSSVIIVAASAAAGRMSGIAEADQRYYAVTSAAELLRDDSRVRFLFVGHGNKKTAAEERIREHGLDKVQLLDFLTGEDFEKAVAVSSCCVVSLEKGLMGTCAPSKYYSYLQGGHPVLAVVEKGSYLAGEIERERLGYSVEPGDAEGLCAAILALLENPAERRAMGERAAMLYEERYAYERAMEKYETMLRELLDEEVTP